MQLKQTTGYVIRMLMYMARNEGAVCSSAELSASLKISQKYTVKMSAALRNAGLIRAHSGSLGGYSLGKPADKIRLYDIVLLTESTVMLHAFTDMDHGAQQAFDTMQRYWENFLKGVTVADLLKDLTDAELNKRILGGKRPQQKKSAEPEPEDGSAEDDPEEELPETEQAAAERERAFAARMKEITEYIKAEWRNKEMDKLSEYINKMQFKKRRVGGVDEENVLVHIKNICEIVREAMEEQEKGFEETSKKLREDQEALKEQLQKYIETCRNMQNINDDLNKRIRELQGEAERYGKAREEAEQTRREYSNKCRELMDTVDTLHSVKKEAEENARREMRERLRGDEEKARGEMLEQIERERKAAGRQLKLLEDEIDALSRQKKAMKESMHREREQWLKHLDWFASHLNADADDTDESQSGDSYTFGYGTNGI